MKSFRLFLEEANKTLTFTFGRFNPPTIGHEKLLNAVASFAKDGDYAIYSSQSQDQKKNPLGYEEKIKFMRKMFPKYARNIFLDKDVKNVFHIADRAYKDGYNRLVMVVGSDRIPEFKALLTKYNGEQRKDGFYHFENGIQVISAGERDPDADDVTGMSASKMRQAAADNNLELFRSGLPIAYGEFRELMNAVRVGMGLKESFQYRKHIALPAVSDIREKYANREIFNPGDSAMLGEKLVTIIARKPNFVVCEDESGQELKCWLNQLSPITEESNDERGASIYDFLIWEPTGDLKTIADNLDKLKPENNELYRGMSAKEYEEFKDKQFVTSKGYGNTRNIKASYVSDNIHLASRFALVAYRDKGEGYLMILDRNKLPDLEKRDQTPAATNYSTPHIPKDSIKKVIQLSKLK